MIRVLEGDCRAVLRDLPDESAHCCVTSPPYFGLRDYGMSGQIGLEPTPDDFVAEMVAVFREVRRVLRDDGTLWLNLGDSYSMTTKGSSGKGEKQVTNAGTLIADRRWQIGPGLKPKDLIGIPWRVAFALQADGWYLRSDIIWAKPNPMPESVTDRPTSAHEHVFLFAKSERYYYDADSVREAYAPASETRYKSEFRTDIPSAMVGAAKHGSMRDGGKIEANPLGRNIRNVWTVATQPYSEAHFATFPPALIAPCIKAGCPVGGTIIDPFGGAGTTALVADRLGRDATLIELNPAYADMARRRIAQDAGMFASVE